MSHLSVVCRVGYVRFGANARNELMKQAVSLCDEAEYAVRRNPVACPSGHAISCVHHGGCAESSLDCERADHSLFHLDGSSPMKV